jgi:hypothetical protein
MKKIEPKGINGSKRRFKSAIFHTRCIKPNEI